jgi:hypothetical protein
MRWLYRAKYRQGYELAVPGFVMRAMRTAVARRRCHIAR